ncbi:hypothetical protein E2562_007857 [Oryza meyeriana var. granulata]|uniref:Uncharacterized protein n=1 Tax=Oryza meyeriana var. granulata TaxID=110450 RepID=A0A6G1F5G0_9ORYZ|nr:hypothetical protein E2562_007857 [Oryza meyeriana var. granulata]
MSSAAVRPLSDGGVRRIWSGRGGEIGAREEDLCLALVEHERIARGGWIQRPIWSGCHQRLDPAVLLEL